MKIINLLGEEKVVNDCLGCELANGMLDVFGGMLYQDEYFNISQDFELPIDGFIIIASNKHYEFINDITDSERFLLINLINKVTKLLRSYEVCSEFNIILEEKVGRHFHVWIMPRHKWMIEKFGNVLKNIQVIQDYAKENMRTEENILKIEDTCKKLKYDLNK